MEDPGTAVDFREGAQDEGPDGESEEVDAECESENGGVSNVIVSCDRGEARGHHRASERTKEKRCKRSKRVRDERHARDECVQGNDGCHTPLCAERPIARVLCIVVPRILLKAVFAWL